METSVLEELTYGKGLSVTVSEQIVTVKTVKRLAPQFNEVQQIRDFLEAINAIASQDVKPQSLPVSH